MTESKPHSELNDVVAKARLYANRKDHTSGEAYVAIITAINALVEQYEVAIEQERLAKEVIEGMREQLAQIKADAWERREQCTCGFIVAYGLGKPEGEK